MKKNFKSDNLTLRAMPKAFSTEGFWRDKSIKYGFYALEIHIKFGL